MSGPDVDRDPGGPRASGPPRMLRRLVAVVAPAELGADLDERFRRRRQESGAQAARAWYRRQALSCVVHAAGLRRRAGSPGGGRFVAALLHDVRDAGRSVVRAPAFSLGTMAVLGLGLGAATLVFAVTDWVILRPVPGVTDADRLVTLRFAPRNEEWAGALFPVANVTVDGLEDGVAALVGLAAYDAVEMHLGMAGVAEPRALSGEVVTGDYFDVLGMRMQLGRGFTAEEGTDPGASRVVVISDRIWRQTLGGDAGVLGRQLQLNGRPFTIVGVVAPGFLGVERPGDTDVWVPIAAHQVVLPGYPAAGVLDDPGMTVFFGLVGRLAPGVGLETAGAQVQAAFSGLEETIIDPARRGQLRPVLEPGVGLMPSVRRNLARTVAILLAVVAFLLLVTCANFANLLLAQGLERRRELAVRAALGASRGRLVWHRILVATQLALGGGAVGFVVARAAVGLLRSTRIVGSAGTLGDIGVDARVAMFVVGAALLTGVLFGAAPALGATRGRAGDHLRGAATAGSGGGRLRTGLMVAQLAVSFALLVSALVSARTLAGMRDVDLGFDPEGVVTFGVQPSLQGLEKDEQVALYRDLLDRLRAAPGVEAAGLSWLVPQGFGRSDTAVALPGADPMKDGVSAASNMVSDGFFSALGMPILAGRDLAAEDLYREDSRVVVVSESLARQLFEGPAVGREVTLAWREGAVYRVIGVVPDARMVGPDQPAGPGLYEPMGQPWLPGTAWVQVRSSLPIAEVMRTVRAALVELAPALPPSDVGTLTAHVERRISEPILVARLSGAFAALAALLAGTGLFGVLSALVAESRHELGVRAAMGATAGALRRLVLRRGLRTALAGLTVGAGLAWALSRGLAAVLPQARPLALAAWAGAVALFLVVVLLAALRPALGAGRLQPMDVLRQG